MKKIPFVILIVCLLVSTASCSSNDIKNTVINNNDYINDEKKIIKIGCCGDSDYIWEAVNKYNKSNSEYIIKIIDYYDENQTTYKESLKDLGRDISTNNSPDIVITSEEMPVEKYVKNGIFEPLDSYINNDIEISNNGYLSNVTDEFKIDGKTWFIVPGYQVYTVICKTKLIDDIKRWTFQDAQDLAVEQGIKPSNIFCDTTAYNVLEMALLMNGSSYYNVEKQECYFNDSRFSKLLEFAALFSKDFDTEIGENSETDNWCLSGKALSEITCLTNFEDYMYELRGYFGEDITMIGFPNESGSGISAMTPAFGLGISSLSNCKNECWNFIRMFLTEEYQNSIDYAFPVMRTAHEKKATDMMNIYTTEDDQEKNEMMADITINDVEIKISPLTQEEYDKVIEFTENVDRRITYNADILNIVQEEAVGFFNGSKSCTDVCELIQSRVSVYINEQ